MKVYRKLGLQPVNGDVGIEIEVEGRNLPEALNYWRVERDGSLRGNSAEYVLRQPLSIGVARDALYELEGAYTRCNTTVHDSVRAGVHVHVNVQQLTQRELFNFVVAYLVLEDMLVHWCGPSRVGNHFCLRTVDADYLVDYIENVLQTGNLKNFKTDEIRYASINLKALAEYGSLEFRAMAGTRYLQRIYDWACLLVRIRDVAKNYESPVHVVEAFFKNEHKFLEEFLGDYLRLLDLSKLDKKGSPRCANDVAHCTSWVDLCVKYVGGLAFPDTIDFPEEPLEDF